MFKALIYLFSLFFFQQMNAQHVANEQLRSTIYDALNSNDSTHLKHLLSSMNRIASKDTLAYSGALRMKLAGLLGTPRDRIREFRKGRMNLEQAIESDSLNTEYRFLRLIIQENAPGIMKYNSQIKDDKHFILTTFDVLPAFLKSEIRRYARSSNVVSEKELKP